MGRMGLRLRADSGSGVANGILHEKASRAQQDVVMLCCCYFNADFTILFSIEIGYGTPSEDHIDCGVEDSPSLVVLLPRPDALVL